MALDLVLVDFDDTLVDTGPRFSERRARLFDFLAAEGFDPTEAHRVHHDVVEGELLPLMGFGPFRLAPSFRDTYLRLCADAGRRPETAAAQAAEALASGIEDPPTLFPGALPALRRLADRHPTVLYTQSGFPDYQLSCIRAAGVLDILPSDRVRITPHKTRSAFEKVLGDFRVSAPHRALMIGNSVRADVNPALEAGARAIWIQMDEVWHHDLGDPLDPQVPRASHFVEAVDSLLNGGPGHPTG